MPVSDLKAAVGRGDGRGDDLAVADENDVGAGDLGAGGVRDHAADGRSRTDAQTASEQAECRANARSNARGCRSARRDDGNRHDSSFVPLGTQAG